MLPSVFYLVQHFTNVGSKLFNDDLDLSHCLYNDNFTFSCDDDAADNNHDNGIRLQTYRYNVTFKVSCCNVVFSVVA